MLAIQAALCGSTGRAEMLVFHTLSEGNIGQSGAPGSGVPAQAVPGVATASPPHVMPAIRKVASSAFVGECEPVSGARP